MSGLVRSLDGPGLQPSTSLPRAGGPSLRPVPSSPGSSRSPQVGAALPGPPAASGFSCPGRPDAGPPPPRGVGAHVGARGRAPGLVVGIVTPCSRVWPLCLHLRIQGPRATLPPPPPGQGGTERGNEGTGSARNHEMGDAQTARPRWGGRWVLSRLEMGTWQSQAGRGGRAQGRVRAELRGRHRRRETETRTKGRKVFAETTGLFRGECHLTRGKMKTRDTRARRPWRGRSGEGTRDLRAQPPQLGASARPGQSPPPGPTRRPRELGGGRLGGQHPPHREMYSRFT